MEEHFKNKLRNISEIIDKRIIKIINSQLDIKVGQFIEEELNFLSTKIRERNAVGLDEIPQHTWKTSKFDDLLLQLCDAVYKENTIEK